MQVVFTSCKCTHIDAGCACGAQVAHMHIGRLAAMRTCWHLALRRILSKDARNALPFAHETRSFDVVAVVALPLLLFHVVPASFLHVQALWQGALELPCLARWDKCVLWITQNNFEEYLLKILYTCRCLCLLRYEPLRGPKVGSFVSKRRHNLQPLGVDRPRVSSEPGRTGILFFPLDEISICPTTSPFFLAISISNRPVEVAFNHSRKNHLHGQMDQRKSSSVSQFLF